jgi:hypothetical protein
MADEAVLHALGQSADVAFTFDQRDRKKVYIQTFDNDKAGQGLMSLFVTNETHEAMLELQDGRLISLAITRSDPTGCVGQIVK